MEIIQRWKIGLISRDDAARQLRPHLANLSDEEFATFMEIAEAVIRLLNT